MLDHQISNPPWRGGQSQSVAKNILAGIHFFILADIFVFSGIFIGFMYDRAADLETFSESAALLNPWSGIINTLILITSGFFVVLAVNCAHKGHVEKMRRWILAAVIVGAGFALSKAFEYNSKLSSGLTMHTNTYFMYYYTMTGAHFVHFLGGIIALVIFYVKSFKAPLDEHFVGNFESAGIYWHMVDFLWIFIFPLLYLLGGA